jgi:hypothetical protein
MNQDSLLYRLVIEDMTVLCWDLVLLLPPGGPLLLTMDLMPGTALLLQVSPLLKIKHAQSDTEDPFVVYVIEKRLYNEVFG